MVALCSMANVIHNSLLTKNQHVEWQKQKQAIKQAKHMAVSLQTSLGTPSLCVLNKTTAWLF